MPRNRQSSSHSLTDSLPRSGPCTGKVTRERFFSIVAKGGREPVYGPNRSLVHGLGLTNIINHINHINIENGRKMRTLHTHSLNTNSLSHY